MTYHCNSATSLVVGTSSYITTYTIVLVRFVDVSEGEEVMFATDPLISNRIVVLLMVRFPFKFNGK